MKQEIDNVKLVLQSKNGINPCQNYAGMGRLAKDSTGFHFVESKKYARNRNTRINERGDENSVFYMRATGKIRFIVFCDADECNQKAIIEKIKPLLKDAKEGGYV